MPKNTADPVGTLTVGNVISASVTLYKSNFKRYFQVSLRATAWAVAMVLAVFVLTFMGGILYGVTNSVLVTVSLGLIEIGVALYYLARYLTDRAVLARLAYQELIDRPETVSIATQALTPRSWGFLRLFWLLGLRMFLVAIVGCIISIVIIVLLAGLISWLKMQTNPLALGLFGLTILGLICLSILAMIRYYSFWFIAELPLAVESSNSASFSLRRSRGLSRKAAGRLQLTILIGSLITSPISIFVSAPVLVGKLMTTPKFSPDPAATSRSLGSLLLGGLFVVVVNELFVAPFWQAIKAVIYYDLRNRREGSDLM
jgi:hypothetical protein